MSGGEQVNIEQVAKDFNTEKITATTIKNQLQDLKDLKNISQIDGNINFSNAEKSLKKALEAKSNIEEKTLYIEELLKVVENIENKKILDGIFTIKNLKTDDYEMSSPAEIGLKVMMESNKDFENILISYLIKNPNNIKHINKISFLINDNSFTKKLEKKINTNIQNDFFGQTNEKNNEPKDVSKLINNFSYLLISGDIKELQSKMKEYNISIDSITENQKVIIIAQIKSGFKYSIPTNKDYSNNAYILGKASLEEFKKYLKGEIKINDIELITNEIEYNIDKDKDLKQIKSYEEIYKNNKIDIDKLLMKKINDIKKLDYKKLNLYELDKNDNKLFKIKIQLKKDLKEKLNKGVQIEIPKTLDELNILFSQKNEKEIYKILGNLGDSKIEEKNKYELFDMYLQYIFDKGDYKKLEDILQKDTGYFHLYSICPSSKKVMELREKIVIEREKNILTNVKNIYGEKLGQEFYDGIKTQMESIKNSDENKHCGFKMMDYIKTFEQRDDVKKYLNEPGKGRKGLSGDKDRVEKLMIQILDNEKAKNNSSISSIADRIGVNEWEIKGKTKEELQNIVGKEGKKLTNKEIESISIASKENKDIDKRKKFIQSMTQKEFDYAWENSSKTPEEIKANIQAVRDSNGNLDLNDLNNNFGEEFENQTISIHNYSFSPETGIITTSENGVESNITLSLEEQKLVKEKPEVAENIVNFYKFFQDLNLEGVWKYRKEFVNSIGSININLDDDSLKKTELIQFGNKLIGFVNNLPEKEGENNKKLSNKNNSISSLKSELRDFSKSGSLLSKNRTFNNLGEDILTSKLRDLGIIGGATFHTLQFRDILSNPQKNG